MLNKSVIAFNNVSPPNLMASIGIPSLPGDFLFFMSFTVALVSSTVISGSSSEPTFVTIDLV